MQLVDGPSEAHVPNSLEASPFSGKNRSFFSYRNSYLIALSQANGSASITQGRAHIVRPCFTLALQQATFGPHLTRPQNGEPDT